jgi:hypothetical protein
MFICKAAHKILYCGFLLKFVHEFQFVLKYARIPDNMKTISVAVVVIDSKLRAC